MISCILRFCLRVHVNWVPSAASARASAGYHSRVSARSLEGETKPSVSVCGKVKETPILGESGGQTKRRAKRGRDGFNGAENWPVTVVQPWGKSSLQPAVSLSVPLSSHLAPPLPRLCLRAVPPPSARLNFFYEHLFKTSIFQPYSPRRHK